jgi:hypothetical protein
MTVTLISLLEEARLNLAAARARVIKGKAACEEFYAHTRPIGPELLKAWQREEHSLWIELDEATRFLAKSEHDVRELEEMKERN